MVALTLQQAGQTVAAGRLYRQVLSLDPGNADGLHQYGVSAYRGGQFGLSVGLILRAIRINGKEPSYYSNLGLALQEMGRIDDVIANNRRAIQLNPEFPEAHCNLSLALDKLGRLDEALVCGKRALAIKPDFAEVFNNLGLTQKKLGDSEGSLVTFGRALKVKPAFVEAFNNRGNTLKAEKRHEEAIAALRAAIVLMPNYADACNSLGAVLQEQRRYDRAEASYRRAVIVNPRFVDAHSNLGTVLKDQGRIDEAIGSLEIARALKPDVAEVHNNLGVARTRALRLPEAEFSLRWALALKPNYAAAHNNLGTVRREQGSFADAVICFRRAIALEPAYADVHLNLGILYLLRGDLAKGWVEQEWRWDIDSMQAHRRSFPVPLWRGEDLGGRIILLYAEQGLGDAIQFCRYVPLVAERGGRVILEVPQSLLRLLRGLAGVERFVAKGDPLPAFDRHCPLMSLPKAFATRIDTIPATIPYLWAEADRVARWRQQLGDAGFRVGIAWQGNPAYNSDRTRSLPLSCFAPLAKIPGVRLISLQKVHGLDQLASLPNDMTVETLDPDFDAGPDAFLDTAALIMTLDLVIAVDSAVIHLAGALGRPAWLPLARVPHWVWMLERTDSPWYPTISLFRQSASGEWGEPFLRMAETITSIRRPGPHDLSEVPPLFATGVLLHEAGRLDEAAGAYRRQLIVDPCHADGLHLLGLIAHERGGDDGSVNLIRRALRIIPDEASYLSNLGLVLQAMGRLGQAVDAYDAAIVCSPEFPTAHANRGVALETQGGIDNAARAYLRALTLKPDLVEALNNLAAILEKQQQGDRACQCLRTAIIIHPAYAEAYNNLGTVLQRQVKLVQSECLYRRSLFLKTDYPEALSNLGALLKDRGESEHAAVSLRRALVLKPGYPEACNNLGAALKGQGRFEAAETWLRRALRMSPRLADAHVNLGILLLLLGRMAEGWAENEWRRDVDRMRSQSHTSWPPIWRGEDLAGKSILLSAEQGMGDIIQFCRYIPMVAARKGRVFLEVPPSMMGLLEGVDGVAQFVATGDALPSHDVRCPLASLPLVFATRADSIPATIPYLSARSGLIAAWRERIGTAGYRIGIVWQGNPSYGGDRARSIPLAFFAPLAQLPGVRLISLQKGHGLAQLDTLPQGMAVETLGPDFDSGPDAFLDTAAVIMTLDLVIAVDSAVIHLAGALGRPAWLPLAAIPHWVWMLERDDTPWYPTIRLFRQRSPGNWPDVVMRMIALLVTIMTRSDSEGVAIKGEIDYEQVVCWRDFFPSDRASPASAKD